MWQNYTTNWLSLTLKNQFRKNSMKHKKNVRPIAAATRFQLTELEFIQSRIIVVLHSH